MGRRFQIVGTVSASIARHVQSHDLPPYSGWRDGHDLHAKRNIGLDPGESDEERNQAIAALDAALAKGEIHHRDFSAVVAILGRAGSRMLSVSLDDMIGVIDQINVPGTVDSHPNWRRRLVVPIESLGELEQVRKITAGLSQSRNAVHRDF